MDSADPRARLAALLEGLDWGRGQSKSALLERLGDDEELLRVVDPHLLDTVYFSARDVIASLPEAAWRNDAAGEQSVGDSAGTMPVAGQVGDDARPRELSSVADPVQADLRSTDVDPRLPAREPESASIPVTGAIQRAVPVALSSVVEGLGQAYNRQPRKATTFFVAGLLLGAASGLLTWLGRRLLGREYPIGPRRVRPFLLGLWSTLYLANLWDAWANATPHQAAVPTGAMARLPRSWQSLAPTREPSTVSSTDVTAELPALDG